MAATACAGTVAIASPAGDDRTYDRPPRPGRVLRGGRAAPPPGAARQAAGGGRRSATAGAWCRPPATPPASYGIRSRDVVGRGAAPLPGAGLRPPRPSPPTGNGRGACGSWCGRWRRWSSRSASTRAIWCCPDGDPPRAGRARSSSRCASACGCRARSAWRPARWWPRSRPTCASRAASRCVAAGDEAAFLAPLPMRRLPGVGPKAERRLQRRGAGDCSATWRRSPTSGWRRLLPGRGGVELRERARGIDPRQVSAEPAEAISISNEETFERDLTDRGELHAELRRMAVGLAASLDRRGLAARTVTTKLRYPDFSIVTRSHTLDAGIDDAGAIADLACLLLDRALEERPDALRLVGVGVSGLRAPQAAGAAGAHHRGMIRRRPGGALRGADARGSTRGRAAACAGTACPCESSPCSRPCPRWRARSPPGCR